MCVCVCVCVRVCVYREREKVRYMREYIFKNSIQFSLSIVSNSCDPMEGSTPGLPVHHQHLELTQTHVHRIGDAIQTISSSVVPYSSCLQSFPASGSFQMSRFFASGDQSTGVSTSASVLPMNIQN